MTTDEELLRIARDVAACAASWEQDARLIGNVTADELLVLANRLPELMAAHEEVLSALADAEQNGRGQCGNFVNQGDGTAKCAACGFCVRGEVRAMRYVEP